MSHKQEINATFKEVWGVNLNFCSELKQSTEAIYKFHFESGKWESRFGKKEKRLALIYEPHSNHVIVGEQNRIRLFTFKEAVLTEKL